MSRKGPAPELQGVEVALAPEELELDPMAMTQKYEEHVREQQAQVEKEDFSDMVAEHAAKQKVGVHTGAWLRERQGPGPPFSVGWCPLVVRGREDAVPAALSFLGVGNLGILQWAALFKDDETGTGRGGNSSNSENSSFSTFSTDVCGSVRLPTLCFGDQPVV